MAEIDKPEDGPEPVFSDWEDTLCEGVEGPKEVCEPVLLWIRIDENMVCALLLEADGAIDTVVIGRNGELLGLTLAIDPIKGILFWAKLEMPGEEVAAGATV